MASESANLAGENAAHTPEDPEAAGKSGEQGAKLGQASSQLGSIDGTINQTKARADSLAAEAAAAKQSNAATAGRLGETEQAIGQVEAKSAELTAQNAAARSRLQGMAGQPAAHRAAADQLDAEGQAGLDASLQLEARLRAGDERYRGAIAAMPAPVPLTTGPAVQRQGYDGRTTYDPAGAIDARLPSWLTGEDPPNAAAAARHKAEEDARRAAEIAEIEQDAGGHFERMSAGQKAGIALSLTGRNLMHEIGDTNLPKFGLTLLRGFIDPRVSLMGVVHGVGQIVSGIANLASAEQWRRDPLGNLLKSSADIATGVTIVLGSIAGLAIAVGIILTAVAIVGSIFSFGAVGLALAPIIAFCGTVASTVGPWALWAAAVALTLHALVFIKNLIDAATASTASGLATELGPNDRGRQERGCDGAADRHGQGDGGDRCPAEGHRGRWRRWGSAAARWWRRRGWRSTRRDARDRPVRTGGERQRRAARGVTCGSALGPPRPNGFGPSWASSRRPGS